MGARRSIRVTRAAQGLLAVLAAALGAACESGDAGPAAPEWPEGTVLAVDDVPITAAEVDELAEAVAVIHPLDSTPSLRRKALTELALYRAVARSHEVDRRAEALEACRAWRAYEVDGAPWPGVGPPAPAAEVRGHWDTLGFPVWAVARGLEIGEWSDVHEGIGRFFVVRVDERVREDRELADEFAIRLRQVAWLPDDMTRAELEELVETRHLRIVDPEWEGIVPAQWTYRMRGETR